MRETVIILYIIVLQLNAAAITAGVLTYLRYQKESLKYFILIIGSLQVIQTGLFIKTIIGYAGNEPPLLAGMSRFFDLSGTAVLLFVLCIFSFFIAGRKPGKWVKLLAAVLPLGFLSKVFLIMQPMFRSVIRKRKDDLLQAVFINLQQRGLI